MTGALDDLRLALRNLHHRPGFAAVIVVTLGLAIGANSALFSLVQAILLDPLPYDDDGQLVRLVQQRPKLDDEMRFSVAELDDYRTRARTLAAVEEYHSMDFTLLGAGEPERVLAGVVSAGLFDLLGVTPILGRGFTAGDEAAGAPAVLLLSHAYWQTRFGGDPEVVGRTVSMNDRSHEVVGVLPPLPHYPGDEAIYVPVSQCPSRSSEAFIANRRARMMMAFGRLAPGIDLPTAQRDVAAVAEQIAADYGEEDYPTARGYATRVVPLRDELVGGARPTLLLLLGGAGFVLLIACANVANLSLSRLAQRREELAVRSALGADRLRLARQLTVEAGVLALPGAAAGLGLAALSRPLLSALGERLSARGAAVELDGTVLLFTAGATVLAVALFGVVPALLSTSGRLGGGEAAGGRAAGQRLQRWLVVAQLALAFVLLVGAGLALRTLNRIVQLDPGYDPGNVLAFGIDLPQRYFPQPDAAAYHRFFDRVLDELRALPEVRYAAQTSFVPLSGGGYTTGLQVEGRPSGEHDDLSTVAPQLAGPGYLDALGIRLLAGRDFRAEDGFDDEPVAIVSQALARREWGNAEPLGRRLRLCSFNSGSCQAWLRVVGVAEDARHPALESIEEPRLYTASPQAFWGGNHIVVRTTGDPMAVARQVTALVRRLDPEAPVYDLGPLELSLRESVAPRRLLAQLTGAFSLVALLVALAGTAGVISFAVAQRTCEIGVRMAVGARQVDVLRLILGQGVALVALGSALGVAGALLLRRALASLVWGIDALDPWTILAVLVALGGATLLACAVPARRAAAIDPLAALRSP